MQNEETAYKIVLDDFEDYMVRELAIIDNNLKDMEDGINHHIFLQMQSMAQRRLDLFRSLRKLAEQARKDIGDNNAEA